MSPKINFTEEISQFTLASFNFVKEQCSDKTRFIKFCNAIGWNVAAIAGEQIDTIRDLAVSATGIADDLTFTSIDSFEDVMEVIEKVQALQKRVTSIRDGIDQLTLEVPQPDHMKRLILRMLEAILLRQLMISYPKFYSILGFLGIVGPKGDNDLPNSTNEHLVNNNHMDSFLGFDHLADIKQFFKNKYYPVGLSTRDETQLVAETFFNSLGKILRHFKIKFRVRRNVTSINDLPINEQGYTQLTFDLPSFSDDFVRNNLMLVFEFLAEEDGGPSICASIIGDLNFSQEFGSWILRLQSTMQSGVLKIGEDSVTTDGSLISDFQVGLSLIRSRPISLLLGANNGTRFQVSDFGLHFLLFVNDGNLKWRCTLDTDSAIIIKGASGDSFLTKITGPSGFKIDVGLEIGYDSQQGLFFGSQLSASLVRTYQINKTLFDFLTIHNLKAALNLNNSNFGTAFSTDISVKFSSAVIIRIDGIGLSAGIDFESETKNIGIGDFGLSFKKPNGLGISLDFGADFKGGGYLYINPPRYYGYLSLSIKSLQLDLIGILVTELPNDPDGYSFLAIVTMDLPTAIPLVFGFYLQGVGGLVGLHRGVDGDAMREGVRTGALNQLFFPENIMDNLDTIIGQMESYFPIVQDTHSFGLLFDLTYGTSDMVHIELCILVSTKPLKIGIAGTIKIKAPEDDPKLVLNCAFLILYDSSKSLISLDARIYDSSIAGIGIEGDIAARFGWGNNKMFMVSVGGFHPQFVPDPAWQVGTMARLALRIRDTQKLKIFVETYFAVTSNTFQIGARGELTYKSGNIGAEAYAGFDALFYFSPFHFTVSIYVGASVSWKDHDLLGVDLEATLTGPGTWNARGSASCTIICFDVNVNFDISWGNSVEQGLPAINVQDILVTELQKDSSWRGTNEKDYNVSYRPVEAPASENDQVLILAPKDKLTVSQLVVPFDFGIQKFGENPVAGPNTFKIDKLYLGNTERPKVMIEDYFAPNQFKSLNDQQRLQSKSYELMKSGARIDDVNNGIVVPAHNTSKTVDYEQVYKGGIVELEPLVFSNGISGLRFAKGGALGRNPNFRKEARKRNVSNKVRVKDTTYRIINKNTLVAQQGSLIVNSKAQAEELMAQQTASNLRIAPRFEYFNSGGIVIDNNGEEL